MITAIRFASNLTPRGPRRLLRPASKRARSPPRGCLPMTNTPSTGKKCHMLTVKRVIESDTCLFCNKQKEVAAVQMDGQTEVLLCWNDVRKMAHMRMRMSGSAAPRAAAANAAVSQSVVPPK